MKFSKNLPSYSSPHGKTTNVSSMNLNQNLLVVGLNSDQAKARCSNSLKMILHLATLGDKGDPVVISEFVR